jgi:hypothetical protein
MQEEHITCKNCGREIPKTQFCIYCGVNQTESLKQWMQEPEHGEVVEEAFEQTETRPSSKAEGASFFQSPYESYKQDIGTPPLAELVIDPEITGLSKELAKLQLWKVKLCSMLVKGEVQEKVFANIYEDYAKKTERLEERRTEIVAKYRNQYDEKRRAVEEVRLKLEELRVRVTLGELSESDRLIRTPGIKGNFDSLEEEASKLENIVGKLENLYTEASSREIFEHEQTAKKFLDSLSDLISAGKIGEEFGKKLREDLENVLGQLSGMYRGEDEDEKSLRTELELLDVRYKVGEITLSELESLRKEITEKLERHWDQSH